MDSSTKEERMILGIRLIMSAWSFQIGAAIIGLFVAYYMGIDSLIFYDVKGGISQEQLTGVVLGGLPFIMVSLAEFLKVPLVKLLFTSKRVIIKVIVVIVLSMSILITYETIASFFERQFGNTVSAMSAMPATIKKLQQINKRIFLIENSNTLYASQLLSELKIKKEVLKIEVGKYEDFSQIYRLTKYRIGVDSISEVTREDATKTAFWWYGSLAALVSTMGVVLAFFGYMLQGVNRK
jgi:hypothetical protein